MGSWNGRPRFKPNAEQVKAMRLVESMVNDGHLVLEPDRYVPDGGLRFQRPIRNPEQPAPPPMRPPLPGSLIPTAGSMLVVLVFVVGVAVGAKMVGAC